MPRKKPTDPEKVGTSEVETNPAVPPKEVTPKDAGNVEKYLTFLEDIVDSLTFKRISLLGLLMIFSLILFSFYENRDVIFGKLTTQKTVEADVASWTLSEANKQALISLAKRTEIGFIVVTDVDLKKNRRSAKFYYNDKEPASDEIRDKALALPRPLFDLDAKNTEQIVAVLSNEFRCDPYTATAYFKYAPDMAKDFRTVCRLAIPPFVGQFVGFVVVGIRGDVSKAELDSIRLEVSQIAVDIYLNDVKKQKTK